MRGSCNVKQSWLNLENCRLTDQQTILEAESCRTIYSRISTLTAPHNNGKQALWKSAVKHSRLDSCGLSRSHQAGGTVFLRSRWITSHRSHGFMPFPRFLPVIFLLPPRKTWRSCVVHVQWWQLVAWLAMKKGWRPFTPIAWRTSFKRFVRYF